MNSVVNGRKMKRCLLISADFLTCLMLPVVAHAQSYQSKMIINVNDYGAVPDGKTDNTKALDKAFSDAPDGSEIYFPCFGAATYHVSQQLNFKSYRTYRGGGKPGCTIESSYSGNSAFNFVGVDSYAVIGLRFYTSNSTHPPKTSINLGRSSPEMAAGHSTWERVQVNGFASEALLYSIGSEENRFFDPIFLLNGGSAKYIFYTSDSDSLEICSCPQASDTDIRVYGAHIEDLTPANADHELVHIGGQETGDISFNGGFGSVWNGTGFVFAPAADSGLQGSITVQDFRIEHADQFARFTGTQVNNVRLIGNTLYSPVEARYFAYSPSTVLFGALFEGNVIETDNLEIGNVFGVLKSSIVLESFSSSYKSMSNGSMIKDANGLVVAGSIRSVEK